MGFFRDLFYGTGENEEDYCFDETDFNRKNEYPEHEEYNYYDYNDGYEEEEKKLKKSTAIADGNFRSYLVDKDRSGSANESDIAYKALRDRSFYNMLKRIAESEMPNSGYMWHLAIDRAIYNVERNWNRYM